MTLTTSDGSLVLVPLFESYAAQISDEMPQPKWSDPIGWSTALRQTADLVGPDMIAVSSTEGLYQDIAPKSGEPLADIDFGEVLAEPSENYVETISIIADVRSEPVLAIVPSPVTVCLECFDDEWIDLLADDEFAALDVLHEVSQMLTDLLRELGGTVEGIVVDCHGFETASNNGLRFDDALLEMGAVFNVAEHYDIAVVGLLPQTLRKTVGEFESDFDAVVFDSVAIEHLETLENIAVQIGGSFPEAFWNLDELSFRDEVITYLDALPQSFILMPSIPATVEPERVQLYRELLEER